MTKRACKQRTGTAAGEGWKGGERSLSRPAAGIDDVGSSIENWIEGLSLEIRHEIDDIKFILNFLDKF